MKALKAICAMILLVAMCCGAAALDVPPLVPLLKGRINDYAAVLTPTQRQDIENKLRGIEEKTTAQVAVLTVKSLDGEDIFAFTQKVFRTWRLGQADKNNGLLIVISKDDRKIRIHPGLGLEGDIPDAEAWSIIRKVMAPKLARGSDDYYGAITDAITRVNELITGQRKPGDKPISSTNNANEGTLILFGVVLLVAGFAGMAHVLAGGVVGALGSGVVSWMIFGTEAAIVGLILGFFVGLIARFILDIVFQVGLGGAAGGFLGGGGTDGGGGSSGDF